ncbi:MAG: hypothetical protein QMC46_00175, partial [Burkholderiaceae bacterium]
CTHRGVQVIGDIDPVAFNAKALQVWVMAFYSGSFPYVQYRPIWFFLEISKSYTGLVHCKYCACNRVYEAWFFCCCPVVILATLGIKLSGALTIFKLLSKSA